MTDLSGEGVRILILATATHTGTALPPLAAVPETFEDLKTAFVDLCGANAESVVGVLNPPDAHTMATRITEEAARARSVLVVYFIGHGLRGPGGELFLAAVDTDELVPGLAVYQALSFSALAQAVQGCRAPAVVVILDCCFSGTAVLDADTASIREFASGAHGRYLVGSAEHLGLAPAGQRHTAFTGALLQLLEQGDPREPAWLSLDAVFDGVYRLLRNTQRGPLPRRQAGDQAGALRIARNAAATPREQEPKAEQAPGRSPYPGLTPFGPEDAGMFFGRSAMLRQVLEALAAATREGGLRILVGASGSGKTSLLNAGVIAVLRDRGLPGVQDSIGWPVRRFTPGSDPLQRLATALDSPDARGVLDVAPTRAATYADTVLSNRLEEKLVMIVDQLEELFTVCDDPTATARFLTALATLSAPRPDGEPRAVVMLALRADFYGRAATYPELVAALRDRQTLIEPMSPQELREAIEKPAERNGWALADGLAEIVLNDLGPDPTAAARALPLLSHVMLSTWDKRVGTTLTVTGYRDTGGIADAIRRSAENIYAGASQTGRDALRVMLPRLVLVGVDGGADTAQPADRVSLTRGVIDPVAAEQVLGLLIAQRLITMDRDIVRLGHEALLREWPRLREWLDSDREWRHRSQQFIAAGREWQQSGSDPALLYRGSKLAAIRDRDIPADQDPILADAVSAAFLTAAVRAERRRTLQRRAVTIVLVVLVVALTSVAVVAVRARNESDRQRDLAVARELVSRSEQLATTDPVGSRLAALAAWRQHPAPDARLAMLTAARNPMRASLIGANGTVFSVAFSPDGHTLASGSGDGTVRLWDASTGQQLGASLVGHTETVYSVAFSPDGRMLATSSGDKTVRLWDTTTRQQIGAPLFRGPDTIGAVVFSPDGRTLVTSGGDGDSAVRLWDIPTRHQVRQFPNIDAGVVTEVALSPDGHTLAAGSSHGTLQLWDTNTGRPIRQPLLREGDDPGISSMAFSPDGRLLIDGEDGDNGLVRLWDTTTGQLIGQPLTGHGGAVNSVVFSPDGHTIASSGNDSTIRLWDTATTQQIGEPLTGHTGQVAAVAFSADGHTIASGGADNTVRLWDVGIGFPTGAPLTTGTDNSVDSVTLSPDGRTLAVPTNNTVLLWDTMTRRQIGTPLDAGGYVTQRLAFSPDGHVLTSASDRSVQSWDITTGRLIDRSEIADIFEAISVAFSRDSRTAAFTSNDGTVRLWDTGTGHKIGELHLEAPDDIITSAAFSPDGHTLASGSQDGTVWLWDINTRRKIGEPLTGHATAIESLAFSPDGHTLASGGNEDRTIRLWDTSTHHRIGEPLTGHLGSIDSMAFGPQGQILASGSLDGEVQLWDTATQRQIGAPLTIPSGSMNTIALSTDGHTIASGGNNGTVWLWNVGFTIDVATTLCSQIGTLTPVQSTRNQSDLPPRQQLCPRQQ